MKHALLLTMYCIFITVLSSCGRDQSTSTDPVLSGGTVTNFDGRGTASVWGITFDVVEPVGTSAGSRLDGTISSDPDETNARNEITIGDDVKIRLEKVPGSAITFGLNGKKYGTLEAGDTVLIDGERNVNVNDSLRHPE
jgi:hypothetical protein